MRLLYFTDGVRNHRLLNFASNRGFSIEDITVIDTNRLWRDSFFVLGGDVLVVNPSIVEIADYLKKTYKGNEVVVI